MIDFGGTLILLSGDFRQTPPVIPRSTYADEINKCVFETIIFMAKCTHIKINTKYARSFITR